MVVPLAQRQTRYRFVTADHMAFLSECWALLHLSVEAPERVPGWDVILLTAASEQQAELYRLEVERARRRGHVTSRTQTLVVPDPDGRRIGSGGATLNALRLLVKAGPELDFEHSRVLLIHGGGDSRRAPWANLLGKPFVPLPLLADADSPLPTLFDHLLAVAAPAAAQMPEGGLFLLTGDVLPLFGAGRLLMPGDAGLVVTTPVSLDVAARHGVIVADREGRVTALLQKPSMEEVAETGALVAGGAALLDTGIYAFTGRAYQDLLDLSQAEPDLVTEVLRSGRELSFYEELVAALVPSHRRALQKRRLGRRLVEALGKRPLFHHRADDMAFIHFGSTAEILQHLHRLAGHGLASRVLAECGSAVEPSALIYCSELSAAAAVGMGSLIYGCRLGRGAIIGMRCVVLGVDSGNQSFRLPDNCCLWQTPLKAGEDGASRLATVCCGVDDNPKDSLQTATFCNQSLIRWMQGHGVDAEHLWDGGVHRTLWNARLFPVGVLSESLEIAGWLLGDGGTNAALRKLWRRSQRHSLATLHEAADATALITRIDKLTGRLAEKAIRYTVQGGLDRNVAALVSQLHENQRRRRVTNLLSRLSLEAASAPSGVPPSRRLQMRSDLCWATGQNDRAVEFSAAAFRAVQEEVADAVEPCTPEPVCGLEEGRRIQVELPVRFDIAGGWSDTPPYCLERPARVLNLAMSLDGALPVGASAEVLGEPRWELALEDVGASTTLWEPARAAAIGGRPDAFALLRTALVLTGYGSTKGLTQGVRVRTWFRAPQGSGLGTSSILAAALVTALQRLAGRVEDSETVSDLVLVLEQMMTTGGGWQDQVGGLVPGVKCISSMPVRPLRLTVEKVPLLPQVSEELQQRMIIAFTGQNRLAKDVLQIVVRRYLQRDAKVLSAIERLVELATEGRKALALGDIDGLGATLREVWQVHQQLDPHCSNPRVDAILHEVEDLASGAKLAGAGGGGFIGILAKDTEAARRTRAILDGLGRGIKTYDWALWMG